MAWISVYEDIYGKKLRRLRKGLTISENEAVGILTRLWLWGINNADRNGMIVSADKEDVEEILGIGLVPGINPRHVVEILIKTGWIDIVDDEMYIHDWEEYRKYWFKYQDTRNKDAERKRIERAAKKAGEKAQNIGNTKKKEDKPDNPSPPPNNEGNKPKYEANFEGFWKEYPRKEGKGESYKKYLARLKDGFSEHELLCAAKNYAYLCRKNHTEQKYIKQGKTFLSESTPFLDYIPKKKETAVSVDDGTTNPFV